MALSHSNVSHRRGLHFETLEARELLTFVMTPQEQLLIELVNRARANPAMEALRYDIDLNDEVEEDALISDEPKQPLAPHQALIRAAGLHSEDMLRRDYFGHDTPEGITPSDRARAAGYPRGAGENIAWFGETQGINRDRQVYERHRGLFLSVGHRVNMMRDTWREIGAGVRYGTFRQLDEGRLTSFQSIMVGTLFGSRGGDAFITGVTISDRVIANNFYEIGEGIGGITITAVREGSGESFTQVTGASGGYALQVPAGTYTLTAAGGRVTNPITVRGVQVSDSNRKIDFNTRTMPTGDIAGEIFHDQNGDGQRDTGDVALENRVAYLDLDASGTRDSGEPVATSTASGSFVFTDLWPDEYIVRQQVPEGWRQTAPDGTWVVTLRGNGDVEGLQFATQPLIKRLQNAAEPRDVNADGFIVAQDALLVIRELNRNGTTVVAQRDFPADTPYYDVNGDGVISSLDALQIIRYLNRRSAPASSSPAAVGTSSPASAAAATELVFATDLASALEADALGT